MKYESEAIRRRVRAYIIIFVIITAVPSVYLAYNVVKRTIFTQNARNFITAEFDSPDTQVISQRFTQGEEGGTIDITLYGKRLSEENIESLRKRLTNYGLDKTTLVVRQGYKEDMLTAAEQEFQRMSENIKVGILEDLYRKNDEALKSKEDQIKLLEDQIVRLKARQYPTKAIREELGILYPALQSIAMGDMVNQQADTICFAVLDFPVTLRRSDRVKITQWLRARAQPDTLVVVFQ